MCPSATKALIHAIVVNWNRPEDTLNCIHSLKAQERSGLHVLLIDNGSTDNSVEIIQTHFPDIDIVTSPINLRFGRGNNLGMQKALQAGADYVLLLNNDATLASDGLTILLNHMHAGVGIAAPLIYYANPPNQIWSTGGKTNRWTLEKSDRYCNQIDPGNWPKVIEQDFVTGCCMLIHRKTLEQVGLFDEDFEMYYEDSDFCLRIREAGLKILVIPSARAWHKVSSSSGGNDSPNQRYWMARSSIHYFHKHAKWWQAPVIFIWRIASALRTTFRLLIKKRGNSILAYWRGLWDGIRFSP